MTKIIITESQFNNLTRSLVSEAVGAPKEENCIINWELHQKLMEKRIQVDKFYFI